IIHMDAIGHEVRADPGMIQKIVQRFGAGVLAPDGAVDRKKLGAIVFGDESQRRALNAIMFEPMKERALAGIAQAKRSGKAMIVIEAAVLNEMKELDDLCDEIWLIDADQSVRHSRLAARGLSREQIGDIEARQKPALDALRGDPRTRIIDNNGSIEALHERVRQLLRSPAAKDGGLGAPAERACAAEVRGLYRIYKQEIDEGMDRKDVKKIAIGFFRSYTVDPCAAVLTGKDDAAVYAQTRFYYSHISLARRLKEYFFRVQSAMRMMHASACSRQAKKMMLPGFRAFIRCLATNLEVNIETVIYPLGENRTDDYGTLDVGYDPQGRLSQITITMPDNSPDAEFHDLAMVLQLFIIRIMHQRGILSREQDILAALPQYYYGERVESPLSHYIDSGISFPLDKVQFEMFLFQLIVDALEVEYGGSVYFTDKEFYRIAEEQERAIQRTRMFCEPFRDGGKDPDAVKLDSLLEHLKGKAGLSEVTSVRHVIMFMRTMKTLFSKDTRIARIKSLEKSQNVSRNTVQRVERILLNPIPLQRRRLYLIYTHDYGSGPLTKWAMAVALLSKGITGALNPNLDLRVLAFLGAITIRFVNKEGFQIESVDRKIMKAIYPDIQEFDNNMGRYPRTIRDGVVEVLSDTMERNGITLDDRAAIDNLLAG
ncbi:MAG TPA: dephospho-CoA kinase, partial [Candidatus Omnitrophota bacterium]|nr:dephospho-CoA kinase [Candidatus Omnitrophota bacterium]